MQASMAQRETLQKMEYSTLQVQHFTTERDMREGLILDTGTTVSVVSNRNLIDDVVMDKKNAITI